MRHDSGPLLPSVRETLSAARSDGVLNDTGALRPGAYTAYESGMRDYARTLGPDAAAFHRWVRQRVERDPAGALTALDLLAGPGFLLDMLRYARKRGFSGEFRGVCVGVEERDGKFMERCAEAGIRYVRADLDARGAWERVRQALDGRGADLVVERGVAGLSALGHTPAATAYWLRSIWDLCATDGQAVLEAPSVHGPAAIKRFAEILREHAVAAETCRMGDESTDNWIVRSLTIRKTELRSREFRQALLQALRGAGAPTA